MVIQTVSDGKVGWPRPDNQSIAIRLSGLSKRGNGFLRWTTRAKNGLDPSLAWKERLYARLASATAWVIW